MHKPKLRKEIGLKQKRKTKKKKEARMNTLKQKLLGLIFDRSPQSNLSQFNEKVVSNFKLKGLGPKKIGRASCRERV